MSKLTRVLTKDEVDDARRAAIEEFTSACITEWGYVPFNSEYFDRNWPPRIGSTAAVPEVWQGT